jgi:hypothetical protein
LEIGFVFGFAAGARLGGEHARGFGLAHKIAGVGFDSLGSGEWDWLAFRHDKVEYGIKSAGAKELRWSSDSDSTLES